MSGPITHSSPTRVHSANSLSLTGYPCNNSLQHSRITTSSLTLRKECRLGSGTKSTRFATSNFILVLEKVVFGDSLSEHPFTADVKDNLRLGECLCIANRPQEKETMLITSNHPSKELVQRYHCLIVLVLWFASHQNIMSHAHKMRKQTYRLAPFRQDDFDDSLINLVQRKATLKKLLNLVRGAAHNGQEKTWRQFVSM